MGGVRQDALPSKMASVSIRVRPGAIEALCERIAQQWTLRHSPTLERRRQNAVVPVQCRTALHLAFCIFPQVRNACYHPDGSYRGIISPRGRTEPPRSFLVAQT